MNMSFLFKLIHKFCTIPLKTPDWTLPEVRMAGEREAISKPFLADRMALGSPKVSTHLGSSDITMEREARTWFQKQCQSQILHC